MEITYRFVKILSKYKILLQNPDRDFNQKRQDKARTAFRKELNARCHTSLTLEQVVRKIQNIKSRLKLKNAKNRSRVKKLPYSGWERMFLNMWPYSGITVPDDEIQPRKLTQRASKLMGTRISTQEKPQSPSGDILQEKPQETRASKSITPEDVVLKHEAEYNSSADTPISPYNASQDFDYDIFDDNDEWMSVDDLKRSVLISQLRTLKAQEDAARVKEKLTLYKLSKLQDKKET